MLLQKGFSYMKHASKILVILALLAAPVACKSKQTPTTSDAVIGTPCFAPGSTAKTSDGKTVTCRKVGSRKIWQ